MKTWIVGLIALALLAPASQAAAPSSLTGTWKVESVTIDGVAKNCIDALARGTLWKLKKAGTATIGDHSDVTWTYDADEGEFVTTQTMSFFWTRKIVYSVTSQGKDVKLKFQFQGKNAEIVLTPD